MQGNVGTKFVVHIDERRYHLILCKVFLALKNADPDYDGEIDLGCFDTEAEAAVARWIAKTMMVWVAPGATSFFSQTRTSTIHARR